MYQHLEKQMRKEKIYTLCAEVNTVPPNPGSQRFHKRLGFKIVASHEHSKDYVVNMLVKQVSGGPKQQPAISPLPKATAKPAYKAKEDLPEQQTDCDVCKKPLKAGETVAQHKKSEMHLKMVAIKSKLYAKTTDTEEVSQSKPKRQRQPRALKSEQPEKLIYREKKASEEVPQAETTKRIVAEEEQKE